VVEEAATDVIAAAQAAGAWYARAVTSPSERNAEAVRGLSFGSAADQYERYRLGYPDELVDAVLQYAERPVRSALEVGAGTGKATRLFASRGIEVTALEPDPDMARVLEWTTRGIPVESVLSTFENFDDGRRFDLLYAAAAWHWTESTSRWARAVELLVPGGVLALFGSMGEPQDPVLRAAVEDVEKQVLPDDDQSVVYPWSIEDMAAADGLTDSAQRDLPCLTTTTAADFTGRLSTVSAYLMLSAEARTEALHRIHAVLPDRFDIDATVQLSLARRP